jgi:hypothetical protein
VLSWATSADEGRDSVATRPPGVEAKPALGSIVAGHRRHDWVLAGVIKALELGARPMRVCDVHRAVEAMLGQPVRPASVRASLASNVSGAAPRFVRIAHGQYRLLARVPVGTSGPPH